jgi:hypothetical protein
MADLRAPHFSASNSKLHLFDFLAHRQNIAILVLEPGGLGAASVATLFTLLIPGTSYSSNPRPLLKFGNFSGDVVNRPERSTRLRGARPR